jgi:hypothetical protein
MKPSMNGSGIDSIARPHPQITNFLLLEEKGNQAKTSS